MKNGMTPKQTAYDLATGWIKCVHDFKTGDLNSLGLTDKELRAVRKQLAVLHNRLMHKAKLDGLFLDEQQPQN